MPTTLIQSFHRPSPHPGAQSPSLLSLVPLPRRRSRIEAPRLLPNTSPERLLQNQVPPPRRRYQIEAPRPFPKTPPGWLLQNLVPPPLSLKARRPPGRSRPYQLPLASPLSLLRPTLVIPTKIGWRHGPNLSTARNVRRRNQYLSWRNGQQIIHQRPLQWLTLQ
jgi:hypothetical protein